jgi:hypothetical protein
VLDILLYTQAKGTPSQKLPLDESKPDLAWAALCEFGYPDLCLREQIERESFDLKELGKGSIIHSLIKVIGVQL